MASVTVPTDSVCDFVLVSNAAPDLARVYVEEGQDATTHAYVRANQPLAVKHVIDGRQAPVAFRSQLAGNSDIVTRKLIVAGSNPGAVLASTFADRASYQPLVTTIEDPTSPYIAVMDGRGNRWFAFLELVSMPFNRLGDYALAEILFTDCATDPAVLESAAPWHP